VRQQVVAGARVDARSRASRAALAGNAAAFSRIAAARLASRDAANDAPSDMTRSIRHSAEVVAALLIGGDYVAQARSARQTER